MAKGIKSKVTAKLESKQVAHGALPSTQSVYGYMGLNQFPYAEKTLDEYKAKLEKMDLADMQRHAVSVANILPNVDRRNILTDKLVTAYLRKQSQFIQDPQRYVEPDASEAIKKLLARGR